MAQFPEQALSAMSNLKRLYLGANQLSVLPPSIAGLSGLEVLYLGGNQLEHLPSALGSLSQLSVLYLGDNRLATLPETVCRMQSLRSLNLHKNMFQVLPPYILQLRSLEQLALRGNPLVSHFAAEVPREVPSLLELCGRKIRTHHVVYNKVNLPHHLVAYLDSAKCCTNPSCDGVYFNYHAKTVDFVDFCGKYRVPLLKYLCTQCPGDRPARRSDARLVQRVLLDDYREPIPEAV